MSDLRVGDQVGMPGVPLVVKVLEIGTCEEGDNCLLGGATFRFADPGTGNDDWAHASEFDVVHREKDGT